MKTKKKLIIKLSALLLFITFSLIGTYNSVAISNARGSDKCVEQTECETIFTCSGSGDLCDVGEKRFVRWFDN